ncbi:MAG: hypothetical protein WC949_01445 [Candidatus Paceibacterota bacterium]|jgi:ribonuclease D
MDIPSVKDIVLCQDDISDELLSVFSRSKTIAWDIETSGLDWRTEKIATCQIYALGGPAAIVRMGESKPKNLCSLLCDGSVKKIFHYAMFDLRFMSSHWKVEPKNIACTKIAIKLLDPGHFRKHGLKNLLKDMFQIEIDKTQCLSNWFAEELSQDQKDYAVNDVIYLIQLLEKLESELEDQNLLDTEYECFAALPLMVKLEVDGYNGMYDYK